MAAPPGFGETPDRDAKEIFYSLELAVPTFVLAGDDPDEPVDQASDRSGRLLTGRQLRRQIC